MESSSGDGISTDVHSNPLFARCRPLDTDSVQLLLDILESPRGIWAEQRSTIAFGGATVILRSSGEGRFEAIQTQAERVFDRLRSAENIPHVASPRLFGGFAFGDDFAPNSTEGTWEGFDGAMFVLPTVQINRESGRTWLTVTANEPASRDSIVNELDRWHRRLVSLPRFVSTESPGILTRKYVPSKSKWKADVEDAIGNIASGHLQKVVLAQKLYTSLGRQTEYADIIHRLSTAYPDCDRFLYEPGTGGAFYGATPERLVAKRGGSVRTAALAGSTSRGTTSDEDRDLANSLRSSPKDTHEHELVVEAIREQLDPLVANHRAGERDVRQLATVQHLETPIEATLKEDRHVLELVEALHPTPAVGGLPPADATETIRKTETFDRGWYAAPIGWFDAAGDGTFSVAIRSAVTCEDEATLFAGAGIVADSDPTEEWEELQLKYRPILDELE